MRYLKLLIISIVFFFLAIFGVSLLIPSEVRISRAINLAPGSDTVLREVADLCRWSNWYPGLDTLNLEAVSQQGSVVTSARAAGVTLRILQASDSLVKAELASPGKPVVASWQLIHYPNTDTLTLQQYLDFDIGWYPWDKLSSMVLDKTYGPTMEKGLQNLKANL
ncbi:hypothetical protein GCM10027051_25430 [Niabella terrae]